MEAPVLASPRTYPWYEVWQKVYLHPNVQSFLDILADPTASSRRGFLWVAVMAVLGGIIQAAASPFENAGLNIIGGVLGGVICAPIAAVIALAISSALMRLVAGLLGGEGTFERMVYSIAAVQAPASLISIILAVLGAVLRVFPAGATSSQNISPLVCITAPISLAWAIYLIFLEVNAVRAVERISTGKAVLTVFSPILLGLILGLICIAAGVLPFILSSMQQ